MSFDYISDSGRLTRVDISNGMHTEYGYDGIGRQTSILHKDGATGKQGFGYEFAAYIFREGGRCTGPQRGDEVARCD